MMSVIPRPNRRFMLLSAAGLMAPLGAFGLDHVAQMARPPMRCADFLATVGVNTHLSYADSQYNDLPLVLEALKFIGLKFVRDAAVDRSKPNEKHYGALAAAGISFCLYSGPRRTLDETIEQISALAEAHPGAVCGLEGPNEIKPTFAYAGLSGNDAAKAYMVDLRRAASQSPVLRHTPLVSFTTYARTSCECDFANVHPYPKKGRQPAELIAAVRQNMVGPAGVMPGKPIMFTEFGYHTLVGKPAKPAYWQGVSPEIQACLMLNALLDGASLGISRVYLYQLLDAYKDHQSGGNQEAHFGLFNFDGTPKPSAKALRTLFTILRDDKSSAQPFGILPPDAQIDAPPLVKCLPLTHSSGRRFLALWSEMPVWDSEAAAPFRTSPSAVHVAFPAARPLIGFDVVGDGRRIDYGSSRQFVVQVGLGPVILSIT